MYIIYACESTSVALCSCCFFWASTHSHRSHDSWSVRARTHIANIGIRTLAHTLSVSVFVCVSVSVYSIVVLGSSVRRFSWTVWRWPSAYLLYRYSSLSRSEHQLDLFWSSVERTCKTSSPRQPEQFSFSALSLCCRVTSFCCSLCIGSGAVCKGTCANRSIAKSGLAPRLGLLVYVGACSSCELGTPGGISSRSYSWQSLW